MKPRALILLAVLTVSLACSKDRKHGPAMPQVELPPEIEAVYPPARALRVWDDTEIWVQFKQPLDSTTVNSGNVLLKVDTRRFSIAVRWEPGTPGDPDSMRFPHLYGPLPVAAVTSILPYRPGSDGC